MNKILLVFSLLISFQILLFSQNKYVHFEQRRYIVPWQDSDEETTEWFMSRFYGHLDPFNILNFSYNESLLQTTVVSMGEMDSVPGNPLHDIIIDYQAGFLTQSGSGGDFQSHYDYNLNSTAEEIAIMGYIPNQGCYIAQYNINAKSNNTGIVTTGGYYTKADKFKPFSCADDIPYMIGNDYFIIDDTLYSTYTGKYFSSIFNPEVDKSEFIKDTANFRSSLFHISDKKYLMISGSTVTYLEHGKPGRQMVISSMTMNENHYIKDYMLFTSDNVIVAFIDNAIYIGNYENGTFSRQLSFEDIGFIPRDMYKTGAPGDFRLLLQGYPGDVAVIDYVWDDAVKRERYKILAKGYFGGMSNWYEYKFRDYFGTNLLYHENGDGKEKLRIFNWSLKDKTTQNIDENNVKVIYYPDDDLSAIVLPIKMDDQYNYKTIMHQGNISGESYGLDLYLDPASNTPYLFISLLEEDYDDWENFGDPFKFTLDITGPNFSHLVNVNISLDKLKQTNYNPTGIKREFEQAPKIYPTMASNNIFVENIKNTNAKIVSVLGFEIPVQISNGQLNIADIQQGTYFLIIDGMKPASFIKIK